jgi:CPA2 family monovalent cation:H+ antiporter-2
LGDAHAFLETLATVLCVAGVITLLAHRLRLPVIFGYIAAGMIVGSRVLPPPLSADAATVHTLSEIGVILLMFSLGLEFSLNRLARVAPMAGVIAVIECSFMLWLGYEAGRLLGWSPLESFYAGAIVAISSTSVVVKAFQEQLCKGRFTEIVFAILVVEDLIAILLLAVLTTVSTGVAVSPANLAREGGRLAAFLVALLAVGMLLVPRMMRAVARLDRPETTLVASVGLCFASALLASGFGYSVALGAFLTGSLVAESGAAKRVRHLVEPVRDMFAAVFFVSVGMLIDPALVARHWGAVLAFTAIVVGGKVLGVTFGTFIAGNGLRTSVQTGMSLAQIGEFSFIIAGLGLNSGATDDYLFPVAVAVSAVTTLTTPLLIRGSGAVASGIDRHLPRALRTFAALNGSWSEQMRAAERDDSAGGQVRRRVRRLALDLFVLFAAVLGTAMFREEAVAAITARAGLAEDHANLLFLAAALLVCAPFAYGVFRCIRFLGVALAARVIPEAGEGKVDLAAAPRRVLVITLQLGIVLMLGLPILAIVQPFIPGFHGALALLAVLLILGMAFWRSAANLDGHVQAVSQVIVEVLAKQARGSGAGASGGAAEFNRMREMLPGLGHTVPVQVESGHYAAGKKMGEINLGSLTGAMVLVLLRGASGSLVPTGKDTVFPGDVLALSGTPEAVEAARRLLFFGPPAR